MTATTGSFYQHFSTITELIDKLLTYFAASLGSCRVEFSPISEVEESLLELHKKSMNSIYFNTEKTAILNSTISNSYNRIIHRYVGSIEENFPGNLKPV